MSIFNNTSQLVIQGGQFTNVLDSNATSRELDLLRQNVATGAFYDAAERADPPKCYPQTRLAILAEIQKWVRDPDVREKFILWLYGPAGSGKSAIAQSIAEILAKEQWLVASFFFSRTGVGRNDTTRFIASIAHQLCLSMPEIREHVATVMAQDSLIFSRTLLSQMHALIIRPLNAVAATLILAKPAQYRLVIIDGLDEAQEETTQRELLEALAAAIQHLHIPLIFLVASRPETIIRQTLNEQPLQSLTQGLALDENYQPDNDIRIFLTAKFKKVKELHPSGNVLPEPWPSQEEMDYLVRKASGQFIYVSTVMKYIDFPRDNPKRRLKIILGLSAPGKDTPFAQLDALYHYILSSVDNISRVLEILALVFFGTRYGEYYLSVDFIETLLGYDSGDVAAALTDIHALIRVPSSPLSDGSSSDTRLHVYHASLQDFLLDKGRSEHFFLDAPVRHAEIARRLLRYITTAPKDVSEEEHDRFFEVLRGFIRHYEEASHTAELVTDLKNFSLKTFLSGINLNCFYGAPWERFFYYLRIRCGETDIDIYRRLRDEFDTWIRNRYQQYPEFIQTHMSAAYAIPGEFWHSSIFEQKSLNMLVTTHSLPSISRTFIDANAIFNILTCSLPPVEAIRLRKLDGELFCLQGTEHIFYEVYGANKRDTLQNFFTERSRAGVHFADKTKLGNLVKEIVRVVCQRSDNPFPVAVKDHSYDEDLGPPEPRWYSKHSPSLNFFPVMLNAACEDPKLARFLWEFAVQYKYDDPGSKVIADACLGYIKRCGVFIPEHVHRAACSICANYTPIFPTTSLEPEGETKTYTISLPDDASQSGYPTNSPEYVSPKSFSMTLSNATGAASSSSSPRSPNIRHSLAAMHQRPTNIAPLNSHHPSKLETHSANTSTRSRSADPSISSHSPSSSNLSATSRSRTPNPSLTSSAIDLSPENPSAVGSAQRPTSSMFHSTETQGQPSRRIATASTKQLSKKSGHVKPKWR